MIGVAYLAQAAHVPQPDTMISGNWLLAVIPILFAAIAGLLGPVLKRRWQAAAIKDAHVTLKEPVPTIHTKEQVELVTKPQLDEIMKRIDTDIQQIKESLDGERSIARTANGNLHKRIDAMSERLGDRLSKLEGTTEAIEKTTTTLLDLALDRANQLKTQRSRS